MVTKVDYQLLDELKSGKVMNAQLAYRLGYGHNLAGRIYRLRKSGYDIRSWPSDSRYYNYTLYRQKITDDLFETKQLKLNFEEE